MSRHLTIRIFIISFMLILIFFGYRYADKMCREYLGTPLSAEIIKDQISAMTEGARLPGGNWSYGVDISHHQPFVSWKRMKVLVDKQGRTVWKKKNAISEKEIDYVIMKATEGEGFKDWRFKGRWRKAQKYGFKRGAYHFFRPGKDAALQAQNFINQVGALDPKDFPPILDIEKTDELSSQDINIIALEWLQIIEKHYGRKPIVYANPYYLNNILSSEITQRYPIWVANYGVSRPSWGKWDMWQFTDRALIRGIGCADLNVIPLR